MEKLDVLWLDDDSPRKIEDQDGVRIQTVQSCAQAEAWLKSRKELPQWIVVDLIVPQGDWGDEYYAIPGLKYIEHLKEKYNDTVGVVAFSIAMTPEIRREIQKAGAQDAFAKPTVSWNDLVANLRERSTSKAAS